MLSLYCSTRYKSSARDTKKFSIPKACMIPKLNVMMYDRGGGVLVVQIVWLHFSDRFMCKGVDISIYVLFTGEWSYYLPV